RRSHGLVTRARCARALLDQLSRAASHRGWFPHLLVEEAPSASEEPSRDHATCRPDATTRG
ncbi:hypothetical protein K6Y82_44605, partial [Burkholderia cenocepacia]